MIDMFTNYQNLSDYYIPNNLSQAHKIPQSYTKLDPIEASKPYELYNAKGELEGYYWYQGNQLILDFSIDGEFTVESDAILLTTIGEEPTITTEGRLGQKVYNIVDQKCWQCIAYVGKYYTWKLLPTFVYPVGAERSVYVDASDYMKDKTITFTIYNFRFEPIFNRNYAGTTNFKVAVDKELSDILVKGIYYCSLEVSGSSSHQTIFSPDDCKLLVK